MPLDKIRTLLLMFVDVSFVHFVLQTFERVEKLLILVGIVIGEGKLTYSSSGILVKELFSADIRVLKLSGWIWQLLCITTCHYSTVIESSD